MIAHDEAERRLIEILGQTLDLVETFRVPARPVFIAGIIAAFEDGYQGAGGMVFDRVDRPAGFDDGPVSIELAGSYIVDGALVHTPRVIVFDCVPVSDNETVVTAYCNDLGSRPHFEELVQRINGAYGTPAPTTSTGPRQCSGGPTIKTQERARVIRCIVLGHPDWKLGDVAKAARQELPGEDLLSMTSETVRNVCRAMGWSWRDRALWGQSGGETGATEHTNR